MGRWNLKEKMNDKIVSDLTRSYSKDSLVVEVLWRRCFPDKITSCAHC